MMANPKAVELYNEKLEELTNKYNKDVNLVIKQEITG
jgi:hypothetical protein